MSLIIGITCIFITPIMFRIPLFVVFANVCTPYMISIFLCITSERLYIKNLFCTIFIYG